MRFEGKVAIVTGAGRGIGRATAVRLASEGAIVIVNDVDGGAIEATIREVQALQSVRAGGGGASGEAARGFGAVVAGRADITSEDEVDALVDRVVVEHGGVDILVNNAGGARPDDAWAKVVDTTLDAWNGFLALNLTSAFLCSRAVLPVMVDQGRGHIVCLGSISGTNGQVGGAAYAAAKAGLTALVASIAKESAADGVSCNGLIVGNAPFPTRSPERQQELDSFVHLGRVGSHEEFAGAIAFLCSEDAGYLSGAMIPVDGGFHRSNRL